VFSYDLLYLGNLFQCLTTLPVKNIFLIPNLTLPRHSFMLFTQVLSQVTRQKRSASASLSWFYDFRLLAFHIITSCSALGVKELMLRLHGLSFFSAYLVLRREEQVQCPEDSLFHFKFHSEERVKLLRSHETAPVLYCLSLHCVLQAEYWISCFENNYVNIGIEKSFH